MSTAISRKDLVRKFRSLGYAGPISGGKHQFMIKGKQKIRIPNPHVSDIGVGLLKEILHLAGISPEQWDKA
ncbi:MAG: type II toxin-antitoxin system HicA family toxin [Deltaproteobacteria bacterium]|nr:type II toxin-antitoxin system HicA family toxin [Deltaproteobacteria bacterium]